MAVYMIFKYSKRFRFAPSFNNPRTHEYDVALLKFDKPVKFEANVIPICLSDGNEDLAGQTGWITGWGKFYKGKESEYTLQTWSL